MTLPPLRGSGRDDNLLCGLTPAAIRYHRFAIQLPFKDDHQLTTAPHHEELFRREWSVYRRLMENAVTEIMGFAVPQLIDVDESLRIVEMTIVSPPFVLDFAGAALDRRPLYPDDVLAEWQAEKAEQFGDRWPTVRLIMSSFVGLGIYLSDVKPGNIEFSPD